MCSLLGIWAYSRFMTAWSYRYIFMVGNLVYFGAALLDWSSSSAGTGPTWATRPATDYKR